MSCEYCKDGEYVVDDHGIETRIDELGDGYYYLITTVTINLAAEAKIFYTNTRISHCPMCGDKLGKDA